MGFQSENGPLFLPGQGAVLVTPLGEPFPPDDVVKALAAIDPDLRIRWVESAFAGMSAFCIERRWRRGDPRWREVQEGRYSADSAFDTEGRFPREIRTGEMISWLKNRYRDAPLSKDQAAKEAERIVDDRFKTAKAAEEDAINRTVEQGTERAIRESDHDRLVRGGFAKAHPMVPGMHFDGPKRLIPLPSVAEVVTSE